MIAVFRSSKNARNLVQFFFSLIFVLVLPGHSWNVNATWSGRSSTRLAVQQPAQSAEAETLVRTAYALYQNGKFEEALINVNKAKALNPNDFRPHTIAGLVWMAQWKMKSASTEFASAIRLNPKFKELYVLKAKADISIGSTEEAIAGSRKALELDPNYGEAHATIGEALEHDKKRQAEAIAAYQSALKLNPKLFGVYDSLGQLFVNLKDEKQAEEIYRQGMAADPKGMSGRFQLGRLLVKQGKLVEARQLWEARTSDDDRLMPSFINLLTRAENMKRATEGLAQKPNDPNALNEMGLAVMAGEGWVVDGRQERAIVYFRKALAIQPNFVKAQYNIVKAMAQYLADDDKKLKQELAKLRQLDPALAKEMEEYSKKYEGGIVGTPIDKNQ
jgi:tetratricopeptide (TPR) repeat protein